MMMQAGKLDEKSLYQIAKEAEESGIVDGRRARGIRFSCSLLIMMILVGILYRRFSLRSIWRLFHDKDHEEELKKLFSPYFKVDKFPSTSCLTRFVEMADTEALATFLCEWSYQLTDDDGTSFRLWGVDGQASGGSKRQKEGGRPKYNVDYHDLESDILVYMDPVEYKSQESVMVEESIRDVLDGHPNVVFAGDAMMAKLGILEGVLNAGANAMLPVKRNNPKLMDAFCAILEELTLAGSSLVDHYVDINGETDGIGNEVISDTECTYEEEDNKKNGDNPRSRPIRDLVFFEEVYPYVRHPSVSQEVDGTAKEQGTEEAREEGGSDTQDKESLPEIKADGDKDAVGQGGKDATPESTSEEGRQEPSDQAPGPEESSVSADRNATAATAAGATSESPGPGQESTGPASGTQKGNPAAGGQEKDPASALDPDAKGKWVDLGGLSAVFSSSHGRLERREFELITDPSECDIWKYVSKELREKWEPYIVTIGIATRYRATPVTVTIGNGKTKEKMVVYKVTVTRTPYMFSMALGSAEEFACLVRKYWGVEGKLHAVADGLLEQDNCTCWVGNSPGNMSFMKKIAYCVISGVRNAVKAEFNEETPYVSVLEKLSNDLRYIRDLLFKKPGKAFTDFVKNHCPVID